MSGIYINEKHEEGYKWSELLLKEYKLQSDYLLTQARKGRYLSVDGKKLQRHTKTSISELEGLRKKLKINLFFTKTPKVVQRLFPS